jgi:hypothetical protein
MVRAIVGGREFEFEKDKIEKRMRGVQPEPIREHVVELLGTVYPPKQVVATVTGWPRTSFTTMEAQRVLVRAGFRCRRAGLGVDGSPAWIMVSESDDAEPAESGDDPASERLAQLEDALVVVQGAIAEASRRLDRLEQMAG